MDNLIKEIETTLENLNDHRYYNYDKPFNSFKISGSKASEEQEKLIRKGFARSTSAEFHYY